MKAAQVALAGLVAVLVAAATTLFVVDDNAPAWIFTGFGLLGFLSLLGMILSDSRPLPPPRL